MTAPYGGVVGQKAKQQESYFVFLLLDLSDNLEICFYHSLTFMYISI